MANKVYPIEQKPTMGRPKKMTTDDAGKIMQMLNMQDDINSKVHLGWARQKYAWHRAIWTECAELVDLLPWKWWKHGEAIDLASEEKIAGEVVDIFHFYLSALMVGGSVSKAGKESIAMHLADDFSSTHARVATTPYKAYPLYSSAEAVIEEVLTYRDNNGGLRTYGDGSYRGKSMVRLCHAAGLDLDRLFTKYVGKNCLNQLRQQFGYKEGRYRRSWAGEDDNDALVRIQAQLGAMAPAEYGAALYAKLEHEYLSCVAA
jgi:hypothetical protein